MFANTDNYLKRNKVFTVGIYLRLSREDAEKDHGQSESIANQRDFLSKYVIDNNWNLFDVYSDDGYTGTNFDRPAFKRLVKDIESKRINMVITKDLSRLGRDYIETGYYLEKYFPAHNIRYIAVNDGIDTFANSSNNDMSPFKSVINDMYARDISRKVKSVIDNKRSSGLFIGAFAPYGYEKDPLDKNKLVIDEETAPVVKRIFEMYIRGHGYTYIANTLIHEGVSSPLAYKALKTNYKNPKAKLGIWTAETIKVILLNPTYAGDMTQYKCVKTNYKIKQLRNVPRNEWITVENTHEPIIEKSSFEIVQKMIEKNASVEYTSKKNSHLLAGLVFCGDCGERMTFTKTQKGESYAICSKYKRFIKLHYCTRHSVPENELESYVIHGLRKIAEFSINKERLLKSVKKTPGKSNFADLDNEINRINLRLLEIRKALKSLYEDKLRRVLPEDNFLELNQEYNKEREQLNFRLEQLNHKKQQIHQQKDETDSILGLIKDHIEFKKVDKHILMKLINRIEIFEDRKIMIHYKFKKPDLR